MKRLQLNVSHFVNNYNFVIKVQKIYKYEVFKKVVQYSHNSELGPISFFHRVINFNNYYN